MPVTGGGEYLCDIKPINQPFWASSFSSAEMMALAMNYGFQGVFLETGQIWPALVVGRGEPKGQD